VGDSGRRHVPDSGGHAVLSVDTERKDCPSGRGSVTPAGAAGSGSPDLRYVLRSSDGYMHSEANGAFSGFAGPSADPSADPVLPASLNPLNDYAPPSAGPSGPAAVPPFPSP